MRCAVHRRACGQLYDVMAGAGFRNWPKENLTLNLTVEVMATSGLGRTMLRWSAGVVDTAAMAAADAFRGVRKALPTAHVEVELCEYCRYGRCRCFPGCEEGTPDVACEFRQDFTR
ncbi:unnamed protein product [Symbiodinium sp. CCMP2592]|nr:unnamed protein product [Symbiodinium sp. CCMP2592]